MDQQELWEYFVFKWRR